MRPARPAVVVIGGVVAALGLVACAAPAHQAAAPVPLSPAVAAPPARSLYQRLGEKPAIAAVVDEFLRRVAADVRINGRFANTDVERLRGLLVEFFCAATGGPCVYSGRDMRTAHAGFQLIDEEFNALVEDLAAALAALKVPQAEQNEVLGALGPVRPDIVNPPPPPAASADPALIESAGAQVRSLQAAGQEQAAQVLAVAVSARVRGQRSYAEQLFSTVERMLQPPELPVLAPLFREGAPPRAVDPLITLPMSSPAQPKGAVGASDDDEPDATLKRGSLTGELRLRGSRQGAVGAVVLEPVSGRFAKRKPKQRVMEQRDRAFAPHILAVPVGSTVSFPNFDPIYHNVFSLAPVKPFDLGIYRDGESRSVTFDKEGVYRVGCNLHANMSAYVVVVKAPHYAVTDEAGRFRFRNLQPGKYNLRAWSDTTTKPVTRGLTVNVGENAVKLDVPEHGDDDLGADKFGMKRGKGP
jgi:hemoglobin